MSDIFDEVDEILGDVETAEAAADETVETAESNFNESELQDIMAEIESLEKDFIDEDMPVRMDAVAIEMQETAELQTVSAVKAIEEAPGTELAITTPREEVKKTNLQEEIEKELEMSREITDEKKAEVVVPSEKTVLHFEKKTPAPKPASMPSSNSEINFQGQGSMVMNLGFRIGNEEAKLTIDPVKGLTVCMNGVELVISEDKGCSVTMENGVHFTIPLTSEALTSKKKAS